MAEQLTTVVLALGANLGDREANLRRAVRLLDERGVRIDRASSVWETPPIPDDQPWFLNAVVAGETALSPEALLTVCKAIERELGRRPGRRWGPRPMDVDILFHGDIEVGTEELQIPHPRIRERAFVLAPLAEVWGGPLPVLGEKASELLEQLDRSGLRRAGALAWR